MKRATITCVLCLIALSVHADDTPQHVTVKNPELRKELLQRTTTEQNARMAVILWLNEHGLKRAADTDSISAEQKTAMEELSAELKKVDSENSRWLKEVIESYGWPTRTLVGKDGAHAAWLLVQHADADPLFQRKCLDLMIELPRGEVSQEDIAYLTDRVLLAEGKKQVYGTQFAVVDGKLQPRPLEDEGNVDNLRAEVGLPPLAEYARQMEKVYGGTSK